MFCNSIVVNFYVKMLLLLVFLLQRTYGIINETESNYCIDLKPQTSLDMEQLMGMWNGIEIIQHLNKEYRPVPERVCPVVLISDTTHEELQNPYGNNNDHVYHDHTNNNYQLQNLRRPYGIKKHYARNLSLLWDEGSSFTVEYQLRFDKAKPGLWISTGPINDSSVTDRRQISFTGHIQVLKAVGTHLVLTFCHILPKNELFTIILARERHLNTLDLVSIHNLLGRRHLNMYNIQKVCRDSSTMISRNNMLTITTLLFLFVYAHFGRKIVC